MPETPFDSAEKHSASNTGDAVRLGGKPYVSPDSAQAAFAEAPAVSNAASAAAQNIRARAIAPCCGLSRAQTRFLNVASALGGVALLAVFLYVLKILALPVGIAVWTLVLVFCLRGVVNALARRGVKRVWATTVAYLIMALVLGVLGLLMFSPVFGLSSQVEELARNAPSYVNALTSWASGLYARYAGILDSAEAKTVIDEVGKSLSTWAASLAQGSAAGLVGAGSALVNTGVAIGFALVIAFWVLMELPALGRECMRIVGPKREADARFIHFTFTRVMGGYIKGTLVQCVIIGVACSVLFAIARIPNAAALGAITGLLNIIPIVGPWLGGAVAAIVAFFVSPWAALAAIASAVVVQHIVYTFISPKITESSVDVHPALVLFALMCGSSVGAAMGGLMGSLVGMLASIPLTAVAKSLFAYYFEKKTGRRLTAEDGVVFRGKPNDEAKPRR